MIILKILSEMVTGNLVSDLSTIIIFGVIKGKSKIGDSSKE